MATNLIYSRTQIEKIGHAIIYLSTHTNQVSKTKLLKLLYILEELSIQKYGFGFFNIKFDVWQHGPVPREIFIELSEEPSLLSRYIALDKANAANFIHPKIEFDEDEFSALELTLLRYVATYFKDFTAAELISYTHRKHSPWYITAQKNGLIERFENKQLNATDIEVDFSPLFEKDAQRLDFYLENRKLNHFAQTLQI